MECHFDVIVNGLMLYSLFQYLIKTDNLLNIYTSTKHYIDGFGGGF